MELSPRRRALVRWLPLVAALGLLVFVSYRRTLRYHVLPEELEAGRADFAELLDWAEGELGGGTAPASAGMPSAVEALPPESAPLVPALVWLLGAMHSEWERVASGEQPSTAPLPPLKRRARTSSWELHSYRRRCVELFGPLRADAPPAAELEGQLQRVAAELGADDLFGGTLRAIVLPFLARWAAEPR